MRTAFHVTSGVRPPCHHRGCLSSLITTKKELFKFRLVEDEACTLCLLPDSIEHTFLDCTVTTAFYSKAISWFNHENDTDITLSSKQVTFNVIPRLTHLIDYPRCRLHLFVIILKQYIYTCNCLDTKPNMQEFQRKVILQRRNGLFPKSQIFSRSFSLI